MTGNPGGRGGVLDSMGSALVTRRAVVHGAAVGAAALVAACSTPTGTAAGKTTGRTGRGGPVPSRDTTAAKPSTPPPGAWKTLAGELSGDLIRPGDPDYFEAKELFNPRWDGDKPIAVVEAANGDDVSATIAFAKKYGLGIRPKAGGHSYVGASSKTGAIVVSVARMTGVTYNSSTQIATIGAGSMLYPVHATLAQHGRTIPTGTCPTVGAAGLTMGGGMGIASRQYGLTCDQLSAAHIVPADGKERTVSDSVFPGLFWAIRGGGGGNFGIATQFQFHTQPTTSFGFFLQTYPWQYAAAVVRGWSARMNVAAHTTWANLHLEANSDKTSDARIVGVCKVGQESAEAEAMQSAIGVDATSTSLFTKTFLDAMQFLGGGTTSKRQGWAAGSDVLTHMTTPISHALVSVIAKRAAGGQAGVAILDPLTGAVQDKTPTATAFPWRRHLCDIQWYLSMPDHPTLPEIHAAYNWIATGHQAVAPVSAGGYVNYLEPRRKVSTYYGSNLARLQSLKQTWDPGDFFDSPYAIPT